MCSTEEKIKMVLHAGGKVDNKAVFEQNKSKWLLK